MTDCSNNDHESKVVSDIRVNLLGNENLADAFLESTLDNVRVPVVRALVAARSSVFKSLLFGGFSETTEKVVQVEFSGDTINMLVQFCYTDEVELVDESVESVSRLAVAADYYMLPQLVTRCVEEVKRGVLEDPSQACVAFETCNGIEGLKSIEECALEVIRTKAELALLGDINGRAAVCSVSRQGLAAILRDENIHAEEIILFKALERWLRGQDTGAGKRLMPEKEDLAALIRLQNISPTALRDEVFPSGIFTPEQMLSTFEEQAIASEVSHKVKFSSLRAALPTWKGLDSTLFESSGGDDIDIGSLNTELAMGAKYLWKLEVVKKDGLIGVGVASYNAEYLDNERVDEWEWLYCSNGGVYHGEKNISEKEAYGEGNTLLMELDLRGENGGRLSVNSQELFTDMISDDESGSFVPAVCLISGSVRLLAFSVLKY